MPCYHPLKAGQSTTRDLVSRKYKISFKPAGLEGFEPIQLPCGSCKGCRHDRAKQWAARCYHESQLYENNCFITLTFDEKNLNQTGSLVKSDFQKFMKNLRQYICRNVWNPKTKQYDPLPRKHWIRGRSPIRYFHCGEYGENFGRPHHHACLFNFDFPDKSVWQQKSGSILYRSKTLETLWPHGYSSIGHVTYASAAYVARYILKKIDGDLAPGHYQGRQPEYVTMSRRPGIARAWYETYKNTDVFPRDYIVINGIKAKVPKYYNQNYELTNPDEYATIKKKRKDKAKQSDRNTTERLLDAEKIQMAYDKQLIRTYESPV